MKLTEVKYSINNSIYYKCFDKTYNPISLNIWRKISNEIYTPNIESIEDMQKRTLNNLQNEIN